MRAAAVCYKHLIGGDNGNTGWGKGPIDCVNVWFILSANAARGSTKFHGVSTAGMVSCWLDNGKRRQAQRSSAGRFSDRQLENW
jgi:hypothetical protein